jgi:N utilization substance protein A
MANAITANRAELLAIADSVAKEKLIDREIVIEAMEDAIQRSARNSYGAEMDIRAKIDLTTATCGCGACSKWSSWSTTSTSR